MAGALVMALSVAGVGGCSHFTMGGGYVVTARTEDLPGAPSFTIRTKPRGSAGVRASRFGYVAFVDSNVRSGINEAGLNCDKQTLGVASYPAPSAELDNIDAGKLCQWALEGFGSVRELKEGLKGVNFLKSEDPGFQFAHWALRDADGRGLVVEYVDAQLRVYDDGNDDGRTGYGIMTNDPPFPEQLAMVAELKEQKVDMVRVPGSWNSTDRFQRIFLIKSKMPEPQSSEEALMHAVHTLKSVSFVPYSFFAGPRTQWSAVYDHANRTVYWRSHFNQDLQRLRLADADLQGGAPEQELLVNTSRLPWFSDASSLLHPRDPAAVTTLFL